MIKEYTAYYDEYNMEGIQFTFTNGVTTKTTEVFGITQDRLGPKPKVTVEVNEPLSSW